MSSSGSQTVCVTGAGGFIASWLVKLLLERGYTVKGTLRNPGDPKNSHLRSLIGADERLILCKADLLNYNSLRDAIKGCSGVFHIASPIALNMELMKSAVDGTRNVIKAAAESGVHRIVFTSSIAAMHMNPNRSPDAVLDESCWSDLDYCKNTNEWYSYGKTVAEQAASKLAAEIGIELVVVVPAFTVGPMLHSSLNVSSIHMLGYLNGKKKAYANSVQGYVHVRDVAKAHLLVYENPSASGRYLCIDRVLHRSDFVGLLADVFPEYPVTDRCEDTKNSMVQPYRFSNKRLRDLGLRFIPAVIGVYENVVSLQEKGYLSLPRPSQSTLYLPSAL